jgi:hypothetical protein
VVPVRPTKCFIIIYSWMGLASHLKVHLVFRFLRAKLTPSSQTFLENEVKKRQLTIVDSRNIAYTSLYLGLLMDLQCVCFPRLVLIPVLSDRQALRAQVLRLASALPSSSLPTQPRAWWHLALRRRLRRSLCPADCTPHGLRTSRGDPGVVPVHQRRTALCSSNVCVYIPPFLSLMPP